jgi:hypothetical protein
MSNNPNRAQSMDELRAILGQLFTRESVQAGSAFQPLPSDVIISPYSKCGTTWMQQICHGLRTRGSMDYGEITEVIPWIEAAVDLEQELNAVQDSKPRLFKSHASYDQLPDNCRYICVLRDPIDALISLYNFFDGWLMEPGCIEFEEFAVDHYLARNPPNNYWHHLVSWYQQRDNSNLLLLCYEQLKADFDKQLPEISRFLGIELDSELADTVTRQSSMEFMRKHDQHFDDHYLRSKREAAGALPLGSNSSKVNRGDSRVSRKDVSENIEKLMNQRWREFVTPQLGFHDYKELLAS